MAELTPKDFLEKVSAKKIAPVTLFHGEEDFLIDECVDAAIASSLDETTRGFNLDVVYASRASAKDVMAHASSFPMMSEKRVVVVKEFERLVGTDAARETVGNYLARPLESTVLLLVADDPDFRKKPFTDLKKKADVVTAKPLWDNQVPAWVASYVRSRHRQIDGEACRMLQGYVGNSLRGLSNEIEKLFVFCGDRNDITVDDVTAVVGASKGFTVFELQNAVGRKNIGEALTILSRMLELGESPQLIIVMLTRYASQLLRVIDMRQKRIPETEFASALHLHPFAAKSVAEAATRFTAAHIEHWFRALRDADLELKSSGRSADLVLDLLIHSLVRGPQQPVRPATHA